MNLTIGIMISIATFLITIAVTFSKQGYDKGVINGKIVKIEDSITEMKKHIDVLYDSRLKTNEAIIKLTENIALMKEQLQKLDSKFDKFDDKFDNFIKGA